MEVELNLDEEEKGISETMDTLKLPDDDFELDEEDEGG